MDKKIIKIIVAEDDAIIGLDIVAFLKRIGYKVTSRVFSAETLVENFKRETPDIVITDILMKGKMDGLEAARIIKKIKDVPILFVSGFGGGYYKKDALSISPGGLIEKPFDIQELKNKIELLTTPN